MNKSTQWLGAVKRSCQSVNLLHNRNPSENLDKLLSLVDHLYKHKGETFMFNRLKAYRLQIQQFCMRQEITPIPFCKTDRDGIAKDISFIKPDRNSVDCIRYSLSVLRTLELLRRKPEYLTDTITQPSIADKKTIDSIRSFIMSWSGIKALPELKPGHFVLSNKAGPNGPATITCLQDLAALRQPENNTLLGAIQEMLKISIPWLDLNKYDTTEEPINRHSKLVLLQDKFGKTRIIAIADWFSNIALTPIHDSFMDGLRRLRGDVTYLQNKIPSLVKDLGDCLYSSDMTAFTDRFPIELEEAVVSAAYGERIGYLWKTILTERKFSHQLGDVRYNCGNPMGVLSSWPVSTFTHHAVKAWCAQQCGLNSNKYNYLILGDDTLDSNVAVAEMYRNTIIKLGVSISISKCTQSKQGYAEFAKRLFSPDGEVTGCPVHLLQGLNKYPEQVLELYRICIERGYSKEYLAPGFTALVSKHKNAKMLTDILSLPERITGIEPLWDPKPDTWAAILHASDEVTQDRLLELSRESLFWDIVNNIDSVAKVNPTSRFRLDPTHPLIFSLSESIERYLPEEAFKSDFEEDEYWIYDRWMEGDYQHLVNIPSVDTYRYYNRGHRVTKCNFDVYARTLQLCSGNANIPLHPRVKYSNQELYDIALGRINPL